MNIGIITAMTSELKQLSNQLEEKTEKKEGPFNYIEGRINNNRIILMQCGIGKVNAAAGTIEMIRNFQPDCIISTGVAGGIDSCLKIMDVVVSRQIVYHDVWCGEGNAYGQIQGLPLFFEGNCLPTSTRRKATQHKKRPVGCLRCWSAEDLGCIALLFIGALQTLSNT